MNVIIGGLAKLAGILCIVVCLSFLFSWPVYMLWNECLVDAVTIVKPVTWLQAWGISVLTSLLFHTNTSK